MTSTGRREGQEGRVGGIEGIEGRSKEKIGGRNRTELLEEGKE